MSIKTMSSTALLTLLFACGEPSEPEPAGSQSSVNVNVGNFNLDKQKGNNTKEEQAKDDPNNPKPVVPEQAKERDKRILAGWTDENIAKDPLGYLRWQKEQMQGMRDKLNGRKVNLLTIQAEIKRRTQGSDLMHQRHRKQLSELVKLYKDAEAKSSWPAVYRGVDFNEPELRNMISKAMKKANAGVSRQDQLQKVKVDKSIREIEQRLALIDSKAIQIEQAISNAQLAKSIGDFDGLLTDINTMMDKVDAVDELTKIEADADMFVETEMELSDEQLFLEALNSAQ